MPAPTPPSSSRKKAGERVEAQVKRQVGQAERQHERRRGEPRRARAERGERQADRRAERKQHPPRERRVAGRNQAGEPDGEPGERGEHGPVSI